MEGEEEERRGREREGGQTSDLEFKITTQRATNRRRNEFLWTQL